MVTDAIADWPRRKLLVLVGLGRRHGVAETELLAGTGLAVAQLSDPRQRPDPDVEWTAIRNLLRHTGPGLPLALEAGLDVHLGSAPVWGEAMRTGRTLGEAMAFSRRYSASVGTAVTARAELAGNLLHVGFDGRRVPADVRPFVVERTMVSTAILVRELLGRPLPLVAARAAVPRPAHAAAVEEFCGVPVAWAAADTVVSAEARWLGVPLPGADPEAHRRAVAECRLLLHRHRARGGVTDRVRAALAEDHSTAVSLPKVAAALGLSERTLRRHLAAEGVTFRGLVAEARSDAARALLRAGLSVEEAAARLGYAEPSAFSHAFKRWTGSPPQEWRRG